MLFPLPVSWPAFTVPDVCRCQTVSVVTNICVAAFETVEVAIEIAPPPLSVQKFSLLPVSWPPYWYTPAAEC